MAELWKTMVMSLLMAPVLCGDAGAAEPKRAKSGAWVLQCRPGDDEFASNCDAERTSAGWRMLMQTGDSQLFLTLAATACPDVSDARNWWRDEILGLSKARRRAKLDQALQTLERSIRGSCTAAPVSHPKLDGVPDIAVRGPP